MKNTILLVLIVCLVISCNTKDYKKNEDGITVNISNDADTLLKNVRLQVLTSKIIRVTSSPKETESISPSLITVEKPREKAKWQVKKNETKVILITDDLNVCVKLKTGEVIFKDKTGNIILKEKEGGGKTFSPANIENEELYQISQVFESEPDEALYGLGQHQHNYMNYKGKNVTLAQHNIVAVVPFLVSSKKYGILWDNYSITKYGDTRDYVPISQLKLSTIDGNPGGLTAKYKIRGKENEIFAKRTENIINYKYLDSFGNLPEGYDLNRGTIIWEGFIEPETSGIHEFSLYSSGYTKIQINGKLFINNWRQNWNPWSRIFQVELEKGRKYPIKLEWIAQGGYIGLEYLPPTSDEEKNYISLYSEAGDALDYYFIYGENIDEVISGYREVTGDAPIMPKWAFGLWQSRERYENQEQLLSVVKEFRKRRIPFDNIVLDWRYWEDDKWGSHEFDASRFPDPKGMINELHDSLNARIMISVWPKFYEGIENYKVFDEKGWLYKRNINNRQKDWIGYVSTFYDAFNPDARKLFWNQINNKLFSLGIDAWWMDATEPDMLSNTSIAERKLLMSPTALGHPAKYFNAYSLMQSKGVYEGQLEESPNQRVFILTRSAFAGQQRYSTATWSGDVAARWYDLEAQIPAGLNFSISGIPYWTTDIGGFSVESSYEPGTGMSEEEWREFITRWFQFGAFCPLFRVHGQFPYREMFNVAPNNHPAYKSMLYYTQLRYRLMPYIYSLAGKTYLEGYTIMRSLVMDFTEDKNVFNIGDQFMFGPSLLINPVYKYKARKRDVYLPEATGWYDLYSGKYYEGGQTIQAFAPYGIIPVFVKEGSIIPFGPEIQYATEKTDPLTIYIYKGNNCSFTLYEDEGANNNYQNGAYSLIPFNYNELSQTLEIGGRTGTFSNMLDTRLFNIIWVDKENPGKLDFNRQAKKEIKYTGDKISILLE